MQKLGMKSATVGVFCLFLAAFSTSTAFAETGTITLSREIKAAPIYADLKDGAPDPDSEVAGETHDPGVNSVGKRDGKEGRLLMRIDLYNIKILEMQNIENVRLVVPHRYPTGDFKISLYGITQEDADWKIGEVVWKGKQSQGNVYEYVAGDDCATWRSKKDGDVAWTGGPGGGEPGEGTLMKEPFSTVEPDGDEDLVFEIPVDTLKEWMKTPVLGENAGMMLVAEQGSTKVETDAAPRLEVDAQWEPDRQYYENVEGEVRFSGGGFRTRERLLEVVLKRPLQLFNPGLSIRTVDSWYGGLQDGTHDMHLVGREDWKRRVSDARKEHLEYMPLAQQSVRRGGEIVGGVEYGLAYVKDKWVPQVEAFKYFAQSEEDAQDALANPSEPGYYYHFEPLSKDLPEDGTPEWWDDEPWNGERPLMVHGMDLHGSGTTKITELKKMKMRGYNACLARHDKETREWADENGFMLTGMPSDTTEEMKKGMENGLSRDEARARELSRYKSPWAVFLWNEDSPGGWVKRLYTGFSERDKNKWPSRVEDFKKLKDGGFAKWAKEKHGTLDTLNRRWGTDYESWDELKGELPRPNLERTGEIYGTDDKGYQWSLHSPFRGKDEAAFLDVYRCAREAWAKYYDRRIREMKKYLPKDRFYYATKSDKDPYIQRASEEFNSAGHDHGPGKYAPAELQILVDTVQIAVGNPAWNNEDHMYNHQYSTPRRVRYDIFTKYLKGQFQSTAYEWTRAWRKKHVWGQHPADARARFNAAANTRNRISQHEDVFRAFLEARSEAGITVLVTEGNRQWRGYYPRPEKSKLGGAVKAYSYVGALGRPWKYVLDRDVSAEHVEDVIIIDAPWLTNDTIERISELPDDRRIIAIGKLPDINEYGEALPEEAYNEVQQRATVLEDWSALSEEVPPAEGLMEPYTRPSEATFWMWGRFRGRPRWSYMMPVPHLEVRRVEHDGKLYVAVANHRDRKISAPIPWAEGREVRNLMGEDPNVLVENTEHYLFGKEDVALFEIQ